MQKIWKFRNHSVVRYVVAGSSAFATQYVVLNGGYYALSLPLHAATSIGYVAGLLVSYLFNRHWVFGEAGKHKHIAHQTSQYVVLVAFNYFFTVLGVSFLKKHGIEPYISPIIITAIITLWNYILYKRVIFRGKPIEPSV